MFFFSIHSLFKQWEFRFSPSLFFFSRKKRRHREEYLNQEEKTFWQSSYFCLLDYLLPIPSSIIFSSLTQMIIFSKEPMLPMNKNRTNGKIFEISIHRKINLEFTCHILIHKFDISHDGRKIRLVFQCWITEKMFMKICGFGSQKKYCFFKNLKNPLSIIYVYL